jgi:hypothetical protein
VLPVATALSAYSICTSLPDGEKVVRLKLYADSPTAVPGGGRQAASVSQEAARQACDGWARPLLPCTSSLVQKTRACGRWDGAHWRLRPAALRRKRQTVVGARADLFFSVVLFSKTAGAHRAPALEHGVEQRPAAGRRGDEP